MFVSRQQIQNTLIPTCNSTALKAYRPPFATKVAKYFRQYAILKRNYLKTCIDQTAIQFYHSAQKKSSPVVVQQVLEKTLHDIYLLYMVENYAQTQTHAQTAFWTMFFVCITHTFW